MVGCQVTRAMRGKNITTATGALRHPTPYLSARHHRRGRERVAHALTAEIPIYLTTVRYGTRLWSEPCRSAFYRGGTGTQERLPSRGRYGHSGVGKGINLQGLPRGQHVRATLHRRVWRDRGSGRSPESNHANDRRYTL